VPEQVKPEPVAKEELEVPNGTSSEDTIQDTQMNESHADTNNYSGYGDVNGGAHEDDSGMRGGDDSYDHEPIGMKEDG
jgi:hypothetical protein